MKTQKTKSTPKFQTLKTLLEPDYYQIVLYIINYPIHDKIIPNIKKFGAHMNNRYIVSETKPTLLQQQDFFQKWAKIHLRIMTVHIKNVSYCI